MLLLSTIVGTFMALAAIFIRYKASHRPATVKKIVLPPVFMSTGFLMFLVPEARLDIYEAFEALAVGMVFSLFLIRTSRFHVRNGQIYLKRSKAFAFLLIGLLFIRVVSKIYLGHHISVVQTSSLFFILAFGMILPWRIAMYLMFRRMARTLGRPVSPEQSA